MVTREELEGRVALVGDNDLGLLLARLEEKAAPLLERRIIVPPIKAQLSAKGGICPSCGAPLLFDPWSADRHRCSRCEMVAAGDAHDAHWARAQHLWVAERIAHLAAVGVFAEHEQAIGKAKELLAAYETLYPSLPNRDNVLGPSHLFFSTYLESIWVLNYLAGATLLRERGWLAEREAEIVNGIADEAAAIIGEFNEGMSNRQTWNSAALTAIGVWFGDDELIRSSVEERTGLVGHLTDGFGSDGMWFEGENYHLFALRGLLTGLQWARVGGADLLEDPALAQHFGQALMAPAWSALPDLTFPARKDARYGVTLAHPAYLECWEAGLGWLGESAPAELVPWLDALYRVPGRPASSYDAYLHDAPNTDARSVTRTDLSWWMLLSMLPELPPPSEPWTPSSALLDGQGLAVLRHGNRYVSLECGDAGGGHGHPDRLHLTVHAGGVHWLPDPGTGSYVERDLFWYRSTWAHNAPCLDGRSQAPDKARCAAFDDNGDWGWIQGEWSGVNRTIVTGPDWLVDLVEYDGPSSRRLELPWHFQGRLEIETAGRWVPDRLPDEFVTDVERFEPTAPGPMVVRAVSESGPSIRAYLIGTVVRAIGPGLPGAAPTPFLVARADGSRVWLGLVLDFGGTLTRASVEPGQASVTTAGGTTRATITKDAVTLSTQAGLVTLGGVRPRAAVPRPLVSARPIRAEGRAIRIDEPPALDGTLDGFDLSAPLELADEMYYNRSEEPYQGPDDFSAVGYVNWDETALHVAVLVTKPGIIMRGSDDPPLELDNEPDDIHSDGVQVYVRLPNGEERGALVRPTENGGILARPIPGGPDEPLDLLGGAALAERGYCLTFALPCPELGHLERQTQIEFDLIVNEMRSDRIRRAGQLVWGGGAGWVYLRGDRHDPDRFGVLDLVS